MQTDKKNLTNNIITLITLSFVPDRFLHHEKNQSGFGLSRFMTFPERGRETLNAATSLSIGASEVVRHDVKQTRITLQLAKFYAHVD